MQIHELNHFSGTLGADSFVAVDNGTDTGKVSTQEILANTEAEISDLDESLNGRIDNIIAGGTAPSAAEVTDARLGANGVVYPSLGEAIRSQVDDLKSDYNEVETNVLKTINLASLSLISQDKSLSTFSVGSTPTKIDSDLYDLVEKIPVKTGVSYTLAPARAWAILNGSGVIVESDLTDHQNTIFSITPSYSGFLCVAYYKAKRNEYFVSETSESTQWTNPSVPTPQSWLLSVLNGYTTDDFERTDTMIRDSYNLVKSTQIEQNTALNGSSIGNKYSTYENSMYDTVIGVKAEAGQEYYVQSSRIFYVVDDLNQILESDTTDRNSTYTYTPTHDGYFVMCYKSQYRGQFFINKKENGSAFEEYDAKFPMPWLLNVINNQSLLFGKTIYNFGDSVSEGGNQEKGPAELVAEETGMTCTDYAVGGASMVNYQDVPGAEARSCIVTQIENASNTEPDFVLLAGGINDLKFTTPGTAPSQPTSVAAYSSAYINGLDITKFSGAFETAIYKVVNKYPTAQLIYMFEQKMRSHFNDGTQDLHDIAIEICKKWGVPVFDMWDYGGLNLAIDAHLVRYGCIIEEGGTVIDGVHYDGTHPNDLGYKKFYVPKLKAKLIECCQTMTAE